MSRSRFVRPELVTLPLSDGDSITVKKRLTAGEQRDAYARLYLAGADGVLRTNPLQSGLAMMTAYLVDWTLADESGARVPIRGLTVKELEDVLNALDPADFVEIKDAIQAHELAQRDEREAQKKMPHGARVDGPTSPSPSAADGASNGSAPLTLTTTLSSSIS